MGVDLKSTLAALASTHQLFTSERDFQFALAWQLKSEGHDLRLEYEPGCVGKNAAIDILITRPELVAVELKYSTIPFEHDSIAVRCHPADVARYGVIVDISRLEAVVAAKKSARGVSILLTNNSKLWTKGQGRSLNCEQFNIHDGRRLAGSMSWASKACANTFKQYPVPVTLKSTYECRWIDYANLGKPNGLFRCLVTDIVTGG